jgi:uncharacterized damage-inducible protein DinB
MFTNLKDAHATLSDQAACTRRVLAAVPESAWVWRPHPKSRTAGELAWHVATGFHWFVADPLKLKVAPKPAAAPTTSAALVEAFDAMSRNCLAALKKKNDAWIRKKADFFGTPTTNGGILGIQAIHEAHHRGQLGLYIRINGGKVPAICGASADEEVVHPKKKVARAK